MKTLRLTAILLTGLAPLATLMIRPSGAQVTTGQTGGTQFPTSGTTTTPGTGVSLPSNQGLSNSAPSTIAPANTVPANGTGVNSGVTQFPTTTGTPPINPVNPPTSGVQTAPATSGQGGQLSVPGTSVSPSTPGSVQIYPNGTPSSLRQGQSGVNQPTGQTSPTSPALPGSVQTPNSPGQGQSGVQAVPNNPSVVTPSIPSGVQIVPGGIQTIPGATVPGQTGTQPLNNSGSSTTNQTPGSTGTTNSTTGPAGTRGQTTSPTGVNQPASGRTSPIETQVVPLGAPVAPQSAPRQPSPTVIIQTPQPVVIQAPSNRAVSTTGVQTISQTTSGQGGQGTLDGQLLQATCSQNWGQAIRIVDRALTAPSAANQANYRSQLLNYRSRLRTLQANRVQVPNWRQQCGG